MEIGKLNVFRFEWVDGAGCERGGGGGEWSIAHNLFYEIELFLFILPNPNSFQKNE